MARHNAANLPASGGGGVPAALTSSLASASMEDALGLSEDHLKSFQKRLTALGFGTRAVDADAGHGTRQAIKDWQASRGL